MFLSSMEASRSIAALAVRRSPAMNLSAMREKFPAVLAEEGSDPA